MRLSLLPLFYCSKISEIKTQSLFYKAYSLARWVYSTLLSVLSSMTCKIHNALYHCMAT